MIFYFPQKIDLLVLLLFFIILYMICSPSFMSQGEPCNFLINRNPSTPHFNGMIKENRSMNESYEGKPTKISLKKPYNSCSKLPSNKSLKKFDERVASSANGLANMQRYDKYNYNPEKRIYFGFSSVRSQPQIKNSNIITSKSGMQDQPRQKLGLQDNRNANNPLQTLRIQKNHNTQVSNLKKTRKSIQFSKQFAFKPLKQSLMSIQSKSNYRHKLQQSLIIVDFFHPSQLKLQQLSRFIETKIPQPPNVNSDI